MYDSFDNTYQVRYDAPPFIFYHLVCITSGCRLPAGHLHTQANMEESQHDTEQQKDSDKQNAKVSKRGSTVAWTRVREPDMDQKTTMPLLKLCRSPHNTLKHY